MAQVTTEYAVPTAIAWAKPDARSYGSQAELAKGSAKARLRWSSNSKTFQVQWRRRGRLSPAAVDALPDSDSRKNSVGAEVWDEWPDEWEGCDLATEGHLDVSDTTRDNGAVMMNDYIEFPDRFAERDFWEVQVRVRAWDSYTYKVSNWCYDTLEVAYVPEVTSISASRNADGTFRFDVESDWQRDGNSLYWMLDQRPYPRYSVPDLGKRWDYDFPVGVAATDATSIRLRYLHVVTCDGATVSRKSTVPIAEHTPATIDAPTVTAEPDGSGGLAVSITSETVPYDSVAAWYEWTDEYGDHRAGQLDVEGSGSEWLANVECPPFDVDIDIRVSVTKDGEWRTVAASASVPSNGLTVWSWEDETFSLYFNPEISYSYSADAESVKLDGDQLPVSRHGTGGTRTISASGTLYELSDRDWLPELQRLCADHDWMLRAPGGARHRVMVKSVTHSRTPGHAVDVSVDMDEVQ